MSINNEDIYKQLMEKISSYPLTEREIAFATLILDICCELIVKNGIEVKQEILDLMVKIAEEKVKIANTLKK